MKTLNHNWGGGVGGGAHFLYYELMCAKNS
jgi:hypothetical protein